MDIKIIETIQERYGTLGTVRGVIKAVGVIADNGWIDVNFDYYATDLDDEAKYLALFPKFVGVKKFRGGILGARLNIRFTANQANGGKNEAGIKRLIRFARAIDATDLTMILDQANKYTNAEHFGIDHWKAAVAGTVDL